MTNTIVLIIACFFILFVGIALGIYMRHQKKIWTSLKNMFRETYIKLDDTRNLNWKKEFSVITTHSSLDNAEQKAYFYTTKSSDPKPLVVSLHTWTGYYTQKDAFADLCLQHDINYIHPDFRGANFFKDACCSKLALNDIDEAISYAIVHANVDPNKIYLIGGSGGAHAALGTFIKSKHKIRKVSSWAAITDLVAWYDESLVLKNNYANNILACTDSKNGILNVSEAQERSPMYLEMPTDRLADTNIYLYHGIYDGIQGSVPITQSINFYNKLLSELNVDDTSKYVSDSEKLQLLEHRKPLQDYCEIGGRKIFLLKQYQNIKLVLFEGNHELLYDYAFKELLEN